MASAADWTGPGGVCPGCRGPTEWTVIGDDVYWACQADCEWFVTVQSQLELFEDTRVAPPEGGAAGESEGSVPTNCRALPWEGPSTFKEV